MNRAWLGLSLLSVSWLFGLGYYHAPDGLMWGLTILAGTGLLYGVTIIRPTWTESVIAAVLLFPAALIVPWPYRDVVLLMAAGLLLATAPIPRLWPTRLGQACLVAGAVLTAQALVTGAYTNLTSRAHDLPHWAAQVPYAAARLLGIDTVLDGSTVALGTVRHVHQLGAAWEWLLDPVTLAFVAGGMVLLILHRCVTVEPGPGKPPAARSILLLATGTLLWLPLRAGLLSAIYAQRALRTSSEAPLALMDQFASPWLYWLLLIGLVLLATRFIPLPASPVYPTPVNRPYGPHRVLFGAAMLAGVFLLTFGLVREPSGPRKQGRIRVDEYHSTRTRTARPYDTEWYGPDADRSYACIYDYCGRFYEMGRLEGPIEPNTLQDCDVLVVNIPTVRYEPNEIECIERFVESGGGLLLIGDPANAFRSGTYLNDIAARFDFRFRDDCVFPNDAGRSELYRPPLAPHPIGQRLGAMNIAASCSIDPGCSTGRAAMCVMGLRSLPADGCMSDGSPEVEDRAESRYGGFIQLWTAARHTGRIAAFTNSALFSNASAFAPGHAELMLGMLEWLNHREPAGRSDFALLVLGVFLIGVALTSARKWPGATFVLLTTALLGAAGAGAAVRSYHLGNLPAPGSVRPLTRVVIDQTVCRPVLPAGGGNAPEKTALGIFEHSILRLGCFTSRAQNDNAFRGDALVLLYPRREAPLGFVARLTDYVSSGGRVLLVDAPANVGSTANALLFPFGMSLANGAPLSGALETPASWPSGVTVDGAAEIRGGEPLIRLNGKPVAATVARGQGRVTVVSFGSRFCDFNIGMTSDVVPDGQLRNVYELQFQLLRSLVGPTPSEPNSAPVSSDAVAPEQSPGPAGE